MNHPPLNSQGIAEWRNNKASAANDGFRWQFMVKNDHPNDVYSGKQGDESSPRLSKVRQSMTPINEAGVFKGGLVPVQLTGWKIHHCTQSAMWIIQENLRLGQNCLFKNSLYQLRIIDSQISDSFKGLLFANKPKRVFKEITLKPHKL